MSAAGTIGSAALAVKSFPAVKQEIGYYMAKYQCKTVDSKKLVDVFGKTVTMDNSTFDPNFVDKQGRTNVQRMEQGLAPIGRDGKSVNMEMSRNVQSGNTQNLKSMVIQRSFPKWSVAERRKTAAASDQAAVCACAHSRYFAGGSPSGLRV